MNTTFGIALTGLLLEHEWPADTTRLIQQVHDALVSNDAERISRASRAAYAVANYAAYATTTTTTTTTTTPTAFAAYAAYAAYTAAAYAAYEFTADYAADYAVRALPGEAMRIRALRTLLTQ